jgi:hypothetical protein
MAPGWQLLVATAVAVEIALFVIAAVHGVRQPIFSNGDEGYHVDYVVHVAHASLPVVGRTHVDPRVLALAQHRYPGPPELPPERAGWAGNSYEAVQPPLYYLLAAPIGALTGDWHRKVVLLRWFSVGLLAMGAALLVPLARTVAPGSPAMVVVAGLAPFGDRGFADSLVRVGNDALLVPLGIGAATCLALAMRDDSVRWLAAGSTLTALTILTKLTAVGLVVLPAAVALVLIRRRSNARPLLAAATPMLLTVPWFAWNRATYGALTGTAVLLRLEKPVVNPHGLDYTYGTELARLSSLLGRLILGQPTRLTSPALTDVAEVVGIALVAATVVAGLLTFRRQPAILILLSPAYLIAAVLIQGAVSQDNPVFHERLLESWLPLAAAAAGLALARRDGSHRVALVATTLLATACAALGWLVPG